MTLRDQLLAAAFGDADDAAARLAYGLMQGDPGLPPRGHRRPGGGAAGEQQRAVRVVALGRPARAGATGRASQPPADRVHDDHGPMSAYRILDPRLDCDPSPRQLAAVRYADSIAPYVEWSMLPDGGMLMATSDEDGQITDVRYVERD